MNWIGVLRSIAAVDLGGLGIAVLLAVVLRDR